MSNHFKNTTLAILLLLITNFVTAQATGNPVKQDENNILKLNLPALVFKNFSVQYERRISKRNSFAVAVRYRPEGSIPFQKTVQDLFTDTAIRLDLAKMGNLGITPEYRFYFGKRGIFNGFYLGVFISYNHYTGDVPVNYYDYVNNQQIGKIAVFKGSMNTYTAGFQLGAQWKLSDKFNVDWWIVGPNYGINNGSFNFSGALNPSFEQLSLFYKLDLIKRTIPLVKIEIPPGSPNDKSASFKTSGSWAGIRALGINLGYRF